MNQNKEQISIKLLESGENDPWYNLAFEEYLLREVEEGEVILYLWQNQNTVVIGRNQNPWKECRSNLLEADGGKLARRLSGGGAVFHDLGNLNFTFIMDKKLYSLGKQLEVILNAARSLGIEAKFSGRNDLLVEDRKFSGNAFYFTEKSAYHHGTILVDSDFAKLVKYLQVSREKIDSKGIDSVRSRVINLKELNSGLSIEKMKKALSISFISLYDKDHLEEYNNLSNDNKYFKRPSQLVELKGLYEKYSSWKWRYGRSPHFDITYNKRFPWGGIELGFTFKKGIVEEAFIYSDAMESELIQTLAAGLKGIPFKLEEILKSLEQTAEDIKEGSIDKGNTREIISDLKSWLKTCDC